MSADRLIVRSAYLSGMLALGSAQAVSEAISDVEAHYANLLYPEHEAPLASISEVLVHQGRALAGITELRRRIIAALGPLYHNLNQAHPHGWKATAITLTQSHLASAGTHTSLWSLNRGLAQRCMDVTQTFASSIADLNPDACSRAFEGIELILEICQNEIDYVASAFSHHNLRKRVTSMVSKSASAAALGLLPQAAPPLLALLIQGRLPRSEFEMFTGLDAKLAGEQVRKLMTAGLITQVQPGVLEPRLPMWFASGLMPNLLDATSS